MKKLGAFQLLGPIALFSAMLAAEGVAYGLERAPSSEWLWYFNLKWFGVFQQSHYTLKAALGGDYEQLRYVAFPLLATAIVGVVFKRALFVAISSNLSFVYMLFVLLSWSISKASYQASLSALYPDSTDSEIFVLVVLFAISMLSFVVSHVEYISKAKLRCI